MEATRFSKGAVSYPNSLPASSAAKAQPHKGFGKRQPGKRSLSGNWGAVFAPSCDKEELEATKLQNEKALGGTLDRVPGKYVKTLFKLKINHS